MPTLSCNCCEADATWIFNDDTLSCADCRDERLNDNSRLETEDDLSWPLTVSTLQLAA